MGFFVVACSFKVAINATIMVMAVAFISRPKLFFLFGALLAAVFVLPAHAFNITESRSYQGTNGLPVGTFVSAVNTDTDQVEPVHVNNIEHALGVVSRETTGLLTLSDKSDNIYVATTGNVTTFVSTANGPIEAGDSLTTSPIEGVLMRAGQGSVRVLGVAVDAFDGTASGTTSTQVTTTSGETINARVGTATIYIDIYANPGGLDSSALQRYGNAIVGKPVTLLQVGIASVFFIVTLVTVTALVYGGLKHSIQAVGRNPLSKKIIVSGLYQVSGLAIFILVVGLLGSYLILWV